MASASAMQHVPVPLGDAADPVTAELLMSDERLIASRYSISATDARSLQLLAARLVVSGQSAAKALPARAKALERLRELRVSPAATAAAALGLRSVAADPDGAVLELAAEAARGVTLPTAFEVDESAAVLPTLSLLDTTVLRGGLPCGMVVELCGEAGSGKTAVAMQWAAVCAAAHRRAVTWVAATPAGFPLQAFLVLVESALARTAQLSDMNVRAALARVTVVSSLHTLSALELALPQLRKQALRDRCGLVVVDSLTALANADTLSSGLALGSASTAAAPPQQHPAAARTAQLLKMASLLKQLAADATLPVVVTNLAAPLAAAGVADESSAAAPVGAEFATSADDRGRLGVGLHHAVNVRCHLERLPRPYRSLFHVLKSPFAASASFAIERRDPTVAGPAEVAAVDLSGVAAVSAAPPPLPLEFTAVSQVDVSAAREAAFANPDDALIDHTPELACILADVAAARSLR